MRLFRLLPTAVLAVGLTAVAAQDPGAQHVGAELVDRELDTRDIVSDIVNSIKNAASCTACQGILLLLKGLAKLGDKAFVAGVSEICELSGAEDKDVCDGLVALEGPIIAQNLRSMSVTSNTAKLFCVTFLGLCPYPDVNKWTVPFPSPKPSKGRPTPSGQKPIKVVHYSDIHIDPKYVPGSNANCTKPICCRQYTANDAPGKTQFPAGRNGDHKCDTPVTLEDSMYAAIHAVAPDAAFSIFTGDVVDHALWDTTQAQNTLSIQDAYTRMSSSGMSLVYGTAGNHEMSPANAFQTNQEGTGSQWMYTLLSGIWSRWVGAPAAASVGKLGAFSTRYAAGNLRVISLNTNLYYIDNFWLYQDPMERDPDGQLAWLVTELDAAERAGERVYIIGHMAMGLPDAFHDASNYFDQIVNRYSATIAAMFFGHTHKDHFQISYSDYNNRQFSTAVAMSYIMPSLTPTAGHPAFRIYTVDPVTFAVLDAETYTADMSDPAFQTTGPVWKRYYSAREVYGGAAAAAVPAELSPAFWHNVTTKLEADPAQFAAYYARKSRGWEVPACDAACARAEICGLRAARAENNCVVPQRGIHFSKRMEARASATTANHFEHRDECGVSALREAVGSLAVRHDIVDLLARRLVEKRAEVERMF